ncbi:DnaJ domain-containing protein [Cladophialophora immunda]|nr:DnaJ domain-containing protein [Cladophialophora immunda]
MANHYSVLGVSSDATYQQIKASYSKLVLQAHPDKGGSQSKFIQIQAAWEVLRDPTARAKYDRECRNTASQNTQKPQHHRKNQTGSGGDHSSAESGPKAGPNFDSWSRYRDSAAGSAYNSHYGSSARAATDGDTKPRASSTPGPEQSSRHPPRNGRTNNRDSHSHSRPQGHNDFPPDNSRPSSPTPAMPAELDVKPIKALTDEASRNLTRYKHLIDMLRSSTRSRPLSQEIQIKLEHVHLFLQNRVLQLKQRLNEIKMHNSNLRTKTPLEPMEPFFVSLWETIVKEDKETMSDVSMSMSRVLTDISQWLRKRKVLEARGLDVTDDDKATQDLRASTEALERLLTKVLLSAPGVAPPRSY